MTFSLTVRTPMVLGLLAAGLCLAGCGGGGQETSGAGDIATAPPTTEALAAAPVSAAAEPDSVLSASALRIRAPTPTTPAGDAARPTRILGVAADMAALGYSGGNPNATTSGVGAVPGCRRGYASPAGLTRATPAELPAAGGIFYTPAELATWRQRVVSGPFVRANDYTNGSPGDWTRIAANASSFKSKGEATIVPAIAEPDFSGHGALARDAAFYRLVTADESMLAPVRAHLLAQAGNAALDFATTLCITSTTGDTTDAWFAQAGWLLRYVVTYDFVRPSLTSADRLAIENFIRRNAYFLAANSDWGLSTVFPARQRGDYGQRDSAAAASTDAAKWWTRRFDTNGDCAVDVNDSATASPAYAYVTANGTLGPRLTVLSQYYNNRRSAATAAFGAAGVLLGDADLIVSAKRYFMEWLTYSVWPDGSQGEYARNGNYCIAPQGLVYGASNEQGAGMLARVLARQGDYTLVNFATTGGLYGSESAGGAAKTLELVIGTRLKLLTGGLHWFFHEPWRGTQNTTATGSLGNIEVHYMGGIRAMDDYHELGLLQTAGLFGKLPISDVVTRQSTVTTLRFPGTTGNAVATGNGSWTDAFGALPAALLLRP